MRRKYSFGLLLLCSGLIFSCSQEKPETEGKGLRLELVDSLVVDKLEPLLMDDYLPEEKLYLLKGSKSRQPMLVNREGEIKELDVLNDGPAGIGSRGAWGYRFLGDDKIIAQGFDFKFHKLDLEGKKTGEVPTITSDIHRMIIYKHRTTFSPFLKDGEPMIIGEEVNAFNPAEVNHQKLGNDYYAKAKTLYTYNLNSLKTSMLESFPQDWSPRAENKYVGESLPFVSYHIGKQEIAVLPSMGNQLFLYDYSGENPELKTVVDLSHRHRPSSAAEVSADADRRTSDYPNFTDVRHAGEYVLVIFSTKIPSDIMRQLIAQDEMYFRSEEYSEASKRYVKTYALVIKDGQQIGSIDEMPSKGIFNLTTEEGDIYFDGNTNSEFERDYNVFYRYRLKE
ncbi:hypothetical protein [Litoribacter populi]|uniref:hypothetical protein n=1 Tax=Litoribacter populi TaxID=2598460 RepID=UPI00117EC60B|nr:hypothetical protein [Litoribacter populi]